MIIVRVQAGLGNQISQYAFSRYLALKGVCDDIRLDFSYFSEGGKAPNYFNTAFVKKQLKYKKADDNDIEFVTGMKGVGKKRSLLKRIRNYSVRRIQIITGYNPFIVQNVSHGYNDDFSGIDWGKNWYFNGTWHNIDYTECLDQLKKELIFNTNIDNLLDDSWKAFFEQGNVIAIHVRMGDYMAPGDPHNILLDSNYYGNAINGMKQKYKRVKFLLFSNEREKAYKAIEPYIKNSEIKVFSQDIEDWEEMYLMTKCKGVICANSTFSYWGGILGYDREKTIMFPQYYAKNRLSWKNQYMQIISLK